MNQNVVKMVGNTKQQVLPVTPIGGKPQNVQVVSEGIFEKLNSSNIRSSMCSCICCDSPCCIKN